MAGPAAGWPRERLGADLAALGVRRGSVLFVQSSLRRVGPVRGGARTLVAALRDALGPEGTLVVYTATPENSDTSPAHWRVVGSMPPAERRAFRARMPAFDRAATPCSPLVGRLSEEVRLTGGAVRSAHPQTSFAALGPRAAELMRPHPLHCHLGEQSPLGRLYAAGAQVLLLGIPDWQCTAYHLAGYRVPDPPLKRYGCVLPGPGGRPRWRHFTAPDLDDRYFPELGRAVRRRVVFAEGRVGAAESYLLPMPPAVDAARAWLAGRPPPTSAGPARPARPARPERPDRPARPARPLSG